MTLRSEQEDPVYRLKGLEKQQRVLRQEKEDLHKVGGPGLQRGPQCWAELRKVESSRASEPSRPLAATGAHFTVTFCLHRHPAE